MEIAPVEMRTTGPEKAFLSAPLRIMRRAIKYSHLSCAIPFARAAKYSHLALFVMLPLLALSQLQKSENLKVGAQRTGMYLPLLYGKNVAIVANQTSQVEGQHLVDFLLAKNINLTRVFAPEHGFRGTASAGKKVADGRDTRTGLPIVSLYGSHKKPTPQDLENVEAVIFDIQDVGARFYTYISTMTYVMEACAENDIPLIVLDRPNPNGYYVDGPVRKPGFESFVGLHPVPLVHGMTVGEYARMVNGEKWLKNGVQCELKVVPCKGYTHRTEYSLPVPPSPNLPNDEAIALYPSLALFEGTNVSVGRGTPYPFQVVGAPWFSDSNTVFTPRDRPGAINPPYEGQECKGFDLHNYAAIYIKGLGELYLYWLQEAYRMAPDKENFFNNYFDKLAGSDVLRRQIKEGVSVEDIRASWQADLLAFRQTRKDYLLYRE